MLYALSSILPIEPISESVTAMAISRQMIIIISVAVEESGFFLRFVPCACVCAGLGCAGRAVLCVVWT